jgi:hypothetical protein
MASPPLLFKVISGDNGLRNAVKFFWNLKSFTFYASGTIYGSSFSITTPTMSDDTWIPPRRAAPCAWKEGTPPSFPYRWVSMSPHFQFNTGDSTFINGIVVTPAGRYGLDCSLLMGIPGWVDNEVSFPARYATISTPISEATGTLEGNAWCQSSTSISSAVLTLGFWDYA